VAARTEPVRAAGDAMNDEQKQFFSLVGQPPARLTVEQLACLLNCQPYDVPILVSARLLKPLGNPMPSSRKYFATVEILELMRDRAWLARVTTALQQYWLRRNGRKNPRSEEPANTFQTLEAPLAQPQAGNGRRNPSHPAKTRQPYA